MSPGCTSCGEETTTEHAPMVVGQPNGAPAVHVQFTIATLGRRSGDRAWVTGTEASALEAFGWVVPVAAT